MTAKLILCGKGKVIFAPDQGMDQTMAATIADALREWDQSSHVVAVFGIPVEVIDNREQPAPGTVAVA